MKRSIQLASLVAASFIVACAAAPPPVNGDWDIRLTAAEGSTGFPINIVANGEQASATGGNTEFTGTWVDEELRLSGDFFVPEAGYTATLDMTIRVDDDKLTGSATWDQFQADVSGERAE